MRWAPLAVDGIFACGMLAGVAVVVPGFTDLESLGLVVLCAVLGAFCAVVTDSRRGIP